MSNITLRPAQRSDIPRLASIANAANAQSALHKRFAPYQNEYPLDYYHWRLNLIRERFATPDLRTVVAVDSCGAILGLASWAVEGEDTALYEEWVKQNTWWNWLEGKLVGLERAYCRWLADKSIDYVFLNSFLAAFLGPNKPARPVCLHLHLIVVDPMAQSRGAGRMLVDWGKELAVREGLPVYLEATLEATGFYKKQGFRRLGKDMVVSPNGQERFAIPVFAWEGKEREGRWLENDGEFQGEERWKWREDVLLKNSNVS